MKAPRSSVRYFCKMLKNPNAIAFLCLNRERERDGSKPNLKCNRILLDEDDKFSPSVAIDYNYSRIFCFSNLYHQIYVYSMSSGNKIVNIAVQNQLFHPILYIYSVYQRNFLIVIGGYVEDKRKTIAEGSNTI